MDTKRFADIERLTNDLIAKYNPTKLSPFPFNKILEDRKDLVIVELEFDRPGTSGAILFNKTAEKFFIIISPSKPSVTKYFTTAHELGHYFLHPEIIKDESILIDGDSTLDGQRALFMLDGSERNELEIEANNFAASLIMPTDLVTDAWNSLKDPVECAKIFNVSLSAMSLRLEKLSLIGNDNG